MVTVRFKVFLSAERYLETLEMEDHTRVSCLHNVLFVSIGIALAYATPLAAETGPPSPAVTRTELESDWLIQARLRFGDPDRSVTPAQDAAGGCDGVIDGKWGFHTALEMSPWWQVDLGQSLPLDRIEIYNRCDDFASRAAQLRVLLSDNAQSFHHVHTHDGSVFQGHSDGKPLVIDLQGHVARYVRLQLPDRVYLHLDEVQVFGMDQQNVAFGKPATQSSVSQWSHTSDELQDDIDWHQVIQTTIDRGRKLAATLATMGVNTHDADSKLSRLADTSRGSESKPDRSTLKATYFAAREIIRRMALANPLLDFDDILFVKRAPSMFPHLSDQYYGWWARPGGGVYILRDFKQPDAHVEELTADWPTGNFLSPDLSFDGNRVMVAFSQHDSRAADIPNKRDKQNVPEQVFYHLFEIDLNSGQSQQVTRGKYDDVDGRYLPDGNLLFLSTRKGRFLQTTPENTQRTLHSNLPDSYVRCGGDDYRPVPVFTLHVAANSGEAIWPVSAFETFEYSPSIANDGRILYCRWDYIDRFNGHFFSLWSANQDGSNSQLVYGNFTTRPQATMEPRAIPNSNKILFTAAAHHSITGGSLVLLDPTRGNEGDLPITRLTPEVPFPETEENVGTYYANPWPLSEDFYLVSWSNQQLPPHGRFEGDRNPVNAQGIYLCDRHGNLELLHRDADLSSMSPIPIKPRPRPPIYSPPTATDKPPIGTFVLQDVYAGLPGMMRGAAKRLRIVGVVPKVQPQMNVPSLGVSHEETGKFVLGSVPIASDGSAHFRVPAGLPVFFQALDENGYALQTMRSLTYLQPGQTLSCVGCHEPRNSAPQRHMPLALQRGPSQIRPPVTGAWPLRFDQLVQPVLNAHCVSCHQPDAPDALAAQFNLQPSTAWSQLLAYAQDDLRTLAFEKDISIPGQGPALQSKLLRYLDTDTLHQALELTTDDRQRLITWMDTYAQTLGSFSSEQEAELHDLRDHYEELFE